MTTSEFSNEFDVLYNSITSNQAPGLDEYEKSVFLTKALNEIVKSYFNLRSNKTQEGFDGSEKRQSDFSQLIRTANLFNVNTYKNRVSDTEKLDLRSLSYILPENYFISINELIYDSDTIYSVIPLAYDEYLRLMLKPYNYPSRKGVWRLISDKKNCNYYQEYVKTSDDKVTLVDYNFLSTWADQKRNLEITIKGVDWNTDWKSDILVITDGTTLKFKLEDSTYGYIKADCGWDSTKLTYTVDLEVSNSYDSDDETIAKTIKEGFAQLKALGDSTEGGWEAYIADKDLKIIKTITHCDGFLSFEAPSKFTNFSTNTGKTITTKVILIPIIEIIGKFKEDITYQIRYIRRPHPIILTDLKELESGLTIEGESSEATCELAEQLHPEILQRAVELAKASYMGDLNSLLTLGLMSETEMGNTIQLR